MTQAALWTLVVLPAVVGGVLALSPRVERLAAPVSVATAAATAALALLVALERPSVSMPFMAGSEFALGVDALSALMVTTVAGVTLLVLMFSFGEIRESRGRFHGLMLLFASGALATSTAETLSALLFAWELMGAASYALIGFWWRDVHRVAAGLTAFVTTRTADAGLYLAAAAALAGGTSLALSELPESTEGWRHVVAGGVLVAALGKSAQLPFSFWLSRAMEGPSPVSALLHSAAMVAMGGYLLLRTEPLLASTGWAAPTAAWLGALTALVLGAVAVAQRDLKQLLAASTAAQLGFVVMAAGLGAVGGGAAHLVAHASTKALLFLTAGAWLTAVGTKDLSGLKGVARRWRLVGWSVTVAALSLAGVAPLALWATKDVVLAAALEESWWLYAVGLAAAGLSAGYAAKILVVIWRGVPEGRPGAEEHPTEEKPSPHRFGVLQQAPLVVLATGAAVLGVLALPPVANRLATALGDEAIRPAVLELVASALIAAVVLAAVWRWYVPEPRWARGWLGLDKASDAVVVQPTLALAAALARFDDGVLDRAITGASTAVVSAAKRAAVFDVMVVDAVVDAISRGSIRAAGRAARDDGRWVDGAVEGVAAQMRRVGHMARRPQSGQLHQYYIQAIAVLVVGVLLLVTVR